MDLPVLYKIIETIEQENVLVTYIPGYWEKDGVLWWPPWLSPNRKNMTIPDENWNRYQCKVLKECGKQFSFLISIKFLIFRRALDELIKKLRHLFLI